MLNKIKVPEMMIAAKKLARECVSPVSYKILIYDPIIGFGPVPSQSAHNNTYNNYVGDDIFVQFITYEELTKMQDDCQSYFEEERPVDEFHSINEHRRFDSTIAVADDLGSKIELFEFGSLADLVDRLMSDEKPARGRWKVYPKHFLGAFGDKEAQKLYSDFRNSMTSVIDEEGNLLIQGKTLFKYIEDSTIGTKHADSIRTALPDYELTQTDSGSTMEIHYQVVENDKHLIEFTLSDDVPHKMATTIDGFVQIMDAFKRRDEYISLTDLDGIKVIMRRDKVQGIWV